MKNSLFLIISFFFFLFLVLILICLTVWGASPDNSTYAGTSCRLTKDCEYGLICTYGVCLIPEGASCAGSKNEGYCVPTSVCVRGVCVPRLVT